MTVRRTSLLVAVALVAAVLGIVAAEPAGAWTRTARRIAGDDRYQTAVDISRTTFPDPAPVVVVASGVDFPDGLSAGPLASLLGGPVLLTAPDAVPQNVLDEVTRLHPGRVIVVGGTKAVSDAAVAQLAATAGLAPERIAGDDRYATAAQVAAAFPAGGAAAYAAAGTRFADALAGGAAAAAQGVPLVLVATDAVPPSTASALSRLQPREVRVLGGTDSVADSAVAGLRAVVPDVRRIAGNDRYATAQAVATDVAAAARPAEALMATGSTFPDALAAAPLAARRQAPILLAPAPCAPPPTVDALRDLGWPDVTMVGGTGVLYAAAGNATPCSPVPDGLIGPGLLLTTAVLPGPQVVHLITVQRSQGYDVRVVSTTGRVDGVRPVTGIARRIGALVAVNGDFFDPGSGEPTHALAVGGRMLRWGGRVDTLVGFDPAKPLYGFFGKPTGGVDIDLGAGAEPLAVDSVNLKAPTGDEVALLTPEWTRPLPAGEWCRAVLRSTGAPALRPDGHTVEPGVVDAAGCSTDPVPRGSDVLVAAPWSSAGATLAALTPGSPGDVRWKLHTTDDGVLDAVGANATLVFGARVASDVDGGACPFFCTRDARTAIAQRPDGNVLIAVVDKRPGWSVGMTPRELAGYLVKMGAIDAANLDGGGSSAMAVRGVLANRPSAGDERAVNTGLVIVPHGTTLTPGG